MKRVIALLVVTCPLLLGTKVVFGQNDEEQIQEALSAFLDAFNNLDWERFQATFTDDATIFLFDWQTAGRRDLQSSGFSVMEERRAMAAQRGSPPYLNLMPRDLLIEVFGDAALVTFHLGIVGSQSTLNQRTLLLVREENTWKIHHLHASTLIPPADSP
jgi:ketosteroid isomerase-like protein